MSDNANRRSGRRLPPRGVRVVCRASALDLGPNLADAILDLSDTGTRLRLHQPVAPGQTVFITITTSANGYTVKRAGKVVWCAPPGPDGQTYVGVSFEKPISYTDLHQLARI